MRPIFVYGTLQQGCSNHIYLAGQRFFGTARTQPGYRLFEAGGFPGMVPWPNDAVGVSGEVWLVDHACLAQLDRLEGIDEGLYRRQPIALLPPFAAMHVETYIYQRSIEGRPAIGDIWRE